MNEQTELDDNQIKQLADSFLFPSTPDIATGVRGRLEVDKPAGYTRSMRLVWAILLCLFLVAGLFMIPQVRAAALRFFNIGAITIFELDETNEPIKETAVISATKPPTSLIEKLGIATEITYTDVLSVTTSYYLPTTPTDLGQPDQLFLYQSDVDWPTTLISVWKADGAQAESLALYQIEAAQFAYKGASYFEETAVNEQRAMWIEGPHLFRLQNAQWQEWQFVEGNVLIWWHEDQLTFRLEGASSLEEALRIAESLTKVEE